jgi:hypothetical protein
LKAVKNTEKLLLIGAPSLTGREEQHKNILRAVKASGVKRVGTFRLLIGCGGKI